MATERPSVVPSNNSHPVSLLERQDPQDALGMEKQTSLLRATFEAVILAFVLVAVFTVGPYAVAKMTTKATPEKDKSAKQQAEPKTATPTDPEKDKDKPETPKVVNKDKPEINKDTLDKLGIGGTKTGTPGFNPLDNKTDDLLKGLDD